MGAAEVARRKAKLVAQVGVRSPDTQTARSARPTVAATPLTESLVPSRRGAKEASDEHPNE